MSNNKHPWYFRLILGILLLVFLEGFSYLTIWILRAGTGRDIRSVSDIFEDQSTRIRRFLEPDTMKLEQFDAELGWRYAPGFLSERHQISVQGLRGTVVYAEAPPPHLFRIAAFGDSFIYGNEVDTPDSWPVYLERELARTEILNFGVGGYGTDQAWLRYQKEGRRFKPRLVLIGFVPDDIRRNVNVYRRFLSDHELPLFKPRFESSDGEDLRLLPNPLKDVNEYRRFLEDPAAVLPYGQHDFWFEPAIYRDPFYDYSAAVRLGTDLWTRFYRKFLDPNRLVTLGLLNTDSEAFRLECRLLQSFAADVRRDGAAPVVLLFPDRNTLDTVARGRPAVYLPLGDHLRARQIPCLDLAEAFIAGPGNDPARWFLEGGHYSPAGNRRVAAWLSKKLRPWMR